MAYTVFQLITAHGTVVGLDKRNGRACHHPVGVAADWIEPLLAVVANGHRNAVFLVGGTDVTTTVLLPHCEWQATVFPLRMGQTERPGHVFLTHPLTGRYLAAEPTTGPEVTGHLPLNRTGLGLWEIFILSPVADDALTPGHGPVLDELCGTITETEGLWQVLANRLVDPAPISGTVFAALAPLLPMRDLEHLAASILRDPGRVARLADMLPADPWAVHAIPALARYLADGRTPRLARGHVGPEYDFLAQFGLDGEYWTTPHLLNTLARRTVPARRRVCILATCRNEGLYLPEWIAYHQSVGIEHFFLFSNDNDDGSDELLDALARSGTITWVTNSFRNIRPQIKAYGYALQFIPDILDYEWTFALDVDEFFAFNTDMFSGIKDYIAWVNTQPTNAIALSWLDYLPGQASAHSDVPVHQRFLDRAQAVDQHVKTLFRTRLFTQSEPHYPIWDDHVRFDFRASDRRIHDRDASGQASPFSSRPQADFAWVNHYHMKSAEEFLMRRTQQRADVAHGDAGPFDVFLPLHSTWFRQKAGMEDMVTDDGAIRCTPDFGARLDALHRLPGVEGACRAIRERFEVRRAEARAAMLAHPRFSVPGSDDQWFRTRLAGG